MKRTILAVALMAMTGAAQAGLWCRNSNGETLGWQIAQPGIVRPLNQRNGVVAVAAKNHAHQLFLFYNSSASPRELSAGAAIL